MLQLQGAFSRLDPTGEWAEKLLDIIPAGRLGEIPEIANLVTYLVSDYASWITGEVSLDLVSDYSSWISGEVSLDPVCYCSIVLCRRDTQRIDMSAKAHHN